MPEERSADLTVDSSGQDFLVLPEYSLILEPDSPNTLVYTDTRGNPTTITAPAGAVTETMAITFTPVTINTAYPAGYFYGGHAFELKAYKTATPFSQFSFQKPVALTIRYSNGEVYGLNENSLVLEYWDDAAGAWNDAAATCSPASGYDRRIAENTIGVGMCSTHRFALFGEEKLSNKIFLYLPLIRIP
jgi:hypothetical protein